jgi:AcrR family transcriptional regulator
VAKLNKADLMAAMADHVRAEGLHGASLRPLAKAAGTSDRMLIYHFGSKEGLVAALLEHLAAEMTAGLEAAWPESDPGPSEAACLRRIVALLRAPEVAPYMRVWLEIVAAAARGEAAFETTAEGILEGYAAWIAPRLPAALPDRTARARAMLALIEGIVVLDAAVLHAAADAAIDRFYPAS